MSKLHLQSDSLVPALRWFKQQGWKPFDFQQEVWEAYLNGESGLLNAPTGSGKTYALWLACLLDFIRKHPNDYEERKRNGLQLIWITPLKALAKDIQINMERACEGMNVPWQVAVRSGDTSTSDRQKQMRSMPECLITTPESLHLLISQKDHSRLFKNLQCVIVDEWHELLGTKRGVQLELGLSRIKVIHPKLKIWGVSATIGNLEQAKDILLGPDHCLPHRIVKSNIEKQIEIESILPDEIEKFPWAGHLGIRMMHKILPIIERSKTTLLFTNTRAQTEIWYQTLLTKVPDLAGQMAMHHGSLDNSVRTWVEDALHQGMLKLVVCTSSLDLGVDFRPVETVIQVGSPKGIARFIQRAGRSGHQPGAVSRIYFLPTHSLELLEGAAIKEAIKQKVYESRKPLEKSFDVLVQYLVTLAVGEGFRETEVFQQVRQTYAFREITQEEWQWALQFITTGGDSLGQYDEFAKVIVDENSTYKVDNRRTAMRHRMSMGTIVSDPVLKVKFISGGFIGTIEESFISRLKKGDNFWFAGRNLKFERIKEMTVLVRKARGKDGIIPRWSGGRMALSTQLSAMIRYKLDEYLQGDAQDIELKVLQPLLSLQDVWSSLPDRHSFLIEKLTSKEGHHVYMYPFAGRAVHELLSTLIAWRISRIHPITFSIAMNDYGFELLSDTEIPLEEALELDLFTGDHLMEDILESVNSTEMAKRRFREIATISGLVFQGYPGKPIGTRHLQATSQIIYDVFREYDPHNLLITQAMQEALYQQVEHSQLAEIMQNIRQQEIIIEHPPYPTPFAFPIMVDRIREKISSESLEDRIRKMQLELEAYAAFGEQ
ncbi:ligase-associated DNA damage response DEXH box helicase [Catalinimonas niigatensis]|uniref:ligase-associated DNA damage response DEXH box helicase n=1 Tax=Catalinimonas niigatensis TaxID=1397264 RepID=UPI002665ACDE|nr:ligase-associated DNA damage response DEXH box helicase [Catalinimonas niigatensis]WPP51574.1 ligase-associated DNA damage response DEXH box helicase [Catalinimonas niigatensis]